ncbi:MAG TPA: kelch repeat-containing protein [Kofleriaceae bacterium]|nr:kelch repeat-containing protein [Kofleriaceae bacterium]
MRHAWVVVVLAACGGTEPEPMDTGWTTGADVAQGAIQETAAVAVAGKVYLIGGLDDSEGTVARVQVYDTATNTWSDGPPLPQPVHHANAITDGTTIYVLGALTNVTAIGDSYKLDPATDTQWTTLAPMSPGRERGAAVVGMLGDNIFVAGGLRNAGASDFLDVYQTVTNTWMPLTSMPAARDHACGAELSGQLIVAGGRMVQTDSPRSEVWAYSVGSNTWEVRASMPTARGGMGCGVVYDRLYTAGGEGNPAVASGVFPNVEEYVYSTDTWTRLADMPNPKHGVGGAAWNGALYLCGGASMEGVGAIATTDVFRP